MIVSNAEGGTRTPTPSRTLRPEHSVSTNSTTSAISDDKYIQIIGIGKCFLEHQLYPHVKGVKPVFADQ